MKIISIGGGPAGLYLAILMKRADPSHEITVIERNGPSESIGFGVVFSDATLDILEEADPESGAAIRAGFAHWGDIDVFIKGEKITSTGHGFCGMSRKTLLKILSDRCEALGIDLQWNTSISDLTPYLDADLVLGADGVNSIVRKQFSKEFGAEISDRPNRFVWLGSTRPFNAFTFFFKENEHGLWRVHAYQYEEEHSTFIIEATEETWRASGMDEATEAETIAYCEALFAEELEGHRLIGNHSIWRSFPTINNKSWWHKNIVLLGDSVHTAHFSIGSGTKLAMEDGIFLRDALLEHDDIPTALAAYQTARKPGVTSLQRAAQVSLEWFENVERYMELDPLQFTFSLLTRSLRITHENLRLRDPKFITKMDQWFMEQAATQSGVDLPNNPPLAPMFTPFKLREMLLCNRVAVSPMCQYSCEDGTPGEWHLVHYGSRAVGGVGLIIAEMTAISADARITKGCAGIYEQSHVEGWRRVVDFVHQNSPAKIGLQLGHAGRKGSTLLAWEGMDQPLKEGGWPIIAASPLPYLPNSDVPKEMARADMDRVLADYVQAAKNAEAAGFDMLEIHWAHGYLLASFVSPLTNLRSDEYGGDLQGRIRFPLEAFDAVRAVWPAKKPISVRISAVDWSPGGTTSDDAAEIARALKAHGCDIIDVSAGQTVHDQKPVYGRQFQTPFSDQIHQESDIATMAVGNISSYMDVNTILAAGRADLCLLARPHLWDPYWTHHAAFELGHKPSWPAPYSPMNFYKPRFK